VRSGSPAPARLVAAAAVALYVVLASRFTADPGLYTDEVISQVTALNFAKGPLASDAVFGYGPDLRLGEHVMPVMLFRYFGSLKSIAFTPVAALADMTPESVRYFTIGVAALGLIATFAWVARLFQDHVVAAVALVLLAVDPAYVFFGRVDTGPTAIALLLKALAGWLLLRWWDEGDTRSLAIGSFALGLGVYDKANFGWVLVAYGVAALAIAGRRLWQRLDGLTIAIAAGAFLVGSLPLVVYNLWSPLATIRGPGGPLPERSGWFLSQLVNRFDTLTGLLDGSAIGDLVGVDLPRSYGVLPFVFLLAALAICMQLALAGLSSRRRRAAAFVLVAAATTLVLLAGTRTSFRSWHVLLVYPLPHVMLAYVIVTGGRWVRSRQRASTRAVAAAATVLLTAACAAPAAVTTAGMLDALQDSSGVWSDRIYSLERYLDRGPAPAPVVVADWGLGQQLVLLSQGHLPVSDLNYALAGGAEGSRRLAPHLRDPRTRYVLHSTRFTQFPKARRRFLLTVRRHGSRLVLARRFADGEGRPLYEVFYVARLR
jgi:hypothetical protein